MMMPAATAKTVRRVLISNDDGIDASGLALLEQFAEAIAEEVWVFAPDNNCSGYGRSLTLHSELKVTHHGPRRFTCNGTPTDCIILAVNHFMKTTPPDLMLSGINLGQNIADDITCSGTIGAAWEAAVHDIPSIALSQRFNRHAAVRDVGGAAADPFAVARKHGLGLIRKLLAEGWPDNILMNVNFPADDNGEIAGIRPAVIGRHKDADEILPGSGENTYRIGALKHRENPALDSDMNGLREGYITITPIGLDVTDYPMLEQLRTVLE